MLFDGSVNFISDSISTENSISDAVAADYYSPGRTSAKEKTENWYEPSPFGVWGALGTRAGQEAWPNPN